VVEVSPLVGHRVMPGGHRLPPPGGYSSRASCGPAPAGPAQLGRRLGLQRGLSMWWPSEVTAKSTMPTTAPVDPGPRGHVVAGQHQHPPAAFASDLDRLHPSLDRSMRAHLHVPDTLEIHTGRLGLPAAPVSVSGPFHAVEAVIRLEAGVAGSLTRGNPTKERTKSLVEAAESSLLRGERPPGHLQAK